MPAGQGPGAAGQRVGGLHSGETEPPHALRVAVISAPWSALKMLAAAAAASAAERLTAAGDGEPATGWGGTGGL